MVNKLTYKQTNKQDEVLHLLSCMSSVPTSFVPESPDRAGPGVHELLELSLPLLILLLDLVEVFPDHLGVDGVGVLEEDWVSELLLDNALGAGTGPDHVGHRGTHVQVALCVHPACIHGREEES